MGQRVEVTDSSGRVWVGTIVPRHELSEDRILPLKLESGYNVGIHVARTSPFRLLEGPRVASAPDRAPAPPSNADAAVPAIALLTTGGTIASRVDYETGGVKPVKEEREILEFYPDLTHYGRVRVVPVFDRLSEDFRPEDWQVIAERVAEAFGSGAQGVVIAHGTDTLGFTAAALSFLLTDLPGPVVLVGAQRSPDRPSSDGASNLRAAFEVARDRRIGEVVVVMHERLSDTRFAIHRGVWVRKMHSSRRDAFESRNAPPLGHFVGSQVELDLDPRPPSRGPARVDGRLDSNAGLLWFYPGLRPERADGFASGLRGLVLAGTGLGHVSADHLPWIRRRIGEGLLVAVTTQCLGGVADPFVYANGRELARAGAIYLDDLLPETAYAKMTWALGQTTERADVIRLLRTPRAGEFVPRHLVAGDQ